MVDPQSPDPEVSEYTLVFKNHADALAETFRMISDAIKYEVESYELDEDQEEEFAEISTLVSEKNSSAIEEWNRHAEDMGEGSEIPVIEIEEDVIH